MPIIEVKLPAGQVSVAAKADMARRLTDVLIEMEGGANTEGGRAFATVLFTEIGDGNWWTGGRSDDRFVTASGRFLVYVTIPEGYMSGPVKMGVQASVTKAILAAIGVAPEDGRSILVIINEVTEGNWAAGGRTISITSIAGTVGLPKDGARFKWVIDYFAAKARQFRASGYPSDVGGLLAEKVDGQSV